MSNRKARPMSAGRMKGKEKDVQLISPQARRSPRHSAAAKKDEAKSPRPPVKRSITVRKIAPRKTQIPETPTPSVRRSPRISAEGNKENDGSTAGKPETKRSTPVPNPAPAASPLRPTAMSPIQAAASPSTQKKQDLRALEWSQKVRRSYSRLSHGDHSFTGSPSSPGTDHREKFFGFEHLQTPPVMARKVEQSGLRIEASICGGSFTLLDGSTCVADPPKPDLNIPGVVVVKEKRKRFRAPQIKMSELDSLAAKMNAEFEEAECFDLVVE
ncbi:sororin [Brienomyrus brachyistius]|uniref:sororin n=1 Tax=Brienomyrus brachyistius TaxID=42636 RepID=UPI0020B38F49|nr:sororin [Brienomyrus brachyistius]